MADDKIHGLALGPRVQSAEAIDATKLQVSFDNGETRIFDAKELMKMSVYKALNQPAFFQSVYVEHGTVTWPHDIDICPDLLYQQSVLCDALRV